MRWYRWLSVTLAVVLVGALSSAATPGQAQLSSDVARLRVQVLERYPHDPTAFTQGLELHDGLMYESTGLYGSSDVRVVVPETGQVLTQVPLAAHFFGEGLTIVEDRILQLTWQENVAMIRDRGTLAEQGLFNYQGEGWGLCYDQPRDRLVMSNGSAELTFRDPDTFEPVGTVAVTLDGQALPMLNELECVGDRVWANVWLTDQIVRIDPATGVVDAVVDASGLLTGREATAADVLNGIAAVPDSDTFMITGKLWPWMFKVRFVGLGWSTQTTIAHG